MGMVWILFGTLIVAFGFFVLAFAQILSIEQRLRRLVVATESRLANVYGLRLTPPGDKSGEGNAPSAAADAAAQGAEGDEE